MPAAAANRPGQRVDDELLPLHPQTGEAGRLLVAADRVHGAPDVRTAQDQGRDQPHDDHHEDRHRQPAAQRVTEVRDRLREGDRAALRDHQGQTAAHRQHGQRRDERRQLPVRDQDAVDQAAGYAGGDREDHRDPDRDALRSGRPGKDGGGQGGDGSDRQVDARRDDHEGHTEGEDGGHGRLDADVQQVVRRQEVARQGRHRDDEDDQRGQRAVVEQEAAHAARGATRARRALERVSGHRGPPQR